EVTFRPAPRTRRIVSRQFCAAGPRNTPHIVAQTVVRAGEERLLKIRLAPGTYRLRTLTGAASATLEILSDLRESPAGCGGAARREAGAALSARLTPEGLEPAAAAASAGPARLLLRNETERPAQIVLETALWDPDCATAAVVSVFQEFRDLFS